MERRAAWPIFIIVITLLVVLTIIGDTYLVSQFQEETQLLTRARRLNLINGGILITISTLLMILFRLQIYSPISKLVASLRRIVDGESEELEPIDHGNLVAPVFYGIEYLYHSLQIQIQDQESEYQSLRSVLKQITDGIVIIDGKGLVSSLNPAAEKIFQTTSAEASGRTVAEVLRHHQWIDLYRASQEDDRRGRATLEIPSQNVFLQGYALPLGETMPNYCLMVFQDLSQIKRLETTRKDFISNISHELRTPLASLKALTDTLQEGALDDPQAARRFLGKMETELDALTQMVSELLELSRIESGRVPLDLKPVSPDVILNQGRERMRVQAERKRLNIEIACQKDLPPVLADERRIQQVLVNLLHNAIKFSDPGEKINLSAVRNGDTVIFAVEDYGTGIADKDLARIFERFYKTDQARSSGGTGLGLSIAKHLVEAHQGMIQAVSSPGEGSTFSFTIPLDLRDNQ